MEQYGRHQPTVSINRGVEDMNIFKQAIALSIWVALAEAARVGEALRTGVKLART